MCISIVLDLFSFLHASCVEDGFVHSAAPSEDEPPVVAKAPVQQKTKDAAPKKAPAAKKPAASRKKAAGIHTLETNTKSSNIIAMGMKS